tara:strand:+ start:367 stop:1041 length:675 start_codon:yes stop_codon:yes gene_type:complete
MPAKTGEHMIKASDLKNYFGQVSQQAPLFFNKGEKRNIPVGSFKNDRFKSDSLICAKCNNSLTQPYDEAWSALHKYLQNNWQTILSKGAVNLSKPFPGSVRKSMTEVHLYFVKLFGCRIAQEGIAIDLPSFSQAVISGKAHPNVYLKVGSTVGVEFQKFVGISPFSASNIVKNGQPAYANWFYTVGDVSVQVMYTQFGSSYKNMKNSWHPKTINKNLKLSKYKI